VEKQSATHSIFEVLKLHKYMSEIQKTELAATTHAIILNNNFGTPQSEKVFQYLQSIYAKHNSRSVDDAVMFHVTSMVADILDEVVQVADENNYSEERYAPFNRLISDETQRYKDIIKEQLIQYLKSFPQIADVDPEIKIQDAKNISDLNLPSYLAICPSNLAEVFNWENSRPAQDGSYVSPKENTEKRENIYDSVLEDLDYLDCLLNDDEKADEGVTFVDVLNAFARYQLHRHTSLHRLYHRNFEILVKIFSDLYSVNLQSRFVKCSCCGEISRDKETNDAIN
jgi:hypothetical protein